MRASSPEVEIVSPAEFKAKLADDANGVLLDVRKPDEFAAGHLQGARLVDWLDPEDFKLQASGLDKSKTVYAYCRSGRRSGEAAAYLAGQGFKVVDMEGGILAWESAGLPVVSACGEE